LGIIFKGRKTKMATETKAEQIKIWEIGGREGEREGGGTEFQGIAPRKIGPPFPNLLPPTPQVSFLNAPTLNEGGGGVIEG
jgi:hypothetical protein